MRTTLTFSVRAFFLFCSFLFFVTFLQHDATAFAPKVVFQKRDYSSSFSSDSSTRKTALFAARARGGGNKLDSPNLWLDEYKTSSGELLDPYKVLKVSRRAELSEIKESYRALSRRYHPDGFRHKRILPGRCSNHDEVREHWERIRLSWAILKHPQTRKRYDRNEVLADPGEAVKRAAVDAAMEGIKGVGKGLFDAGAGLGKGLFSAGAFAFGQMTKPKEDSRAKTKAAPETSDATTNIDIPSPRVFMDVPLYTNGNNGTANVAVSS